MRQQEARWNCRSGIASSRQGKGNNRVPAKPCTFFDFLEQSRLQVFRIGDHFTCSNLSLRKTVIAELAHAQSTFGAHWRPEGSAGHGTRVIEIASALIEVERGTRLLVGEVFKAPALFFCLSE